MSTDQPDPYVVLGVRSSASEAEITAAYRRALRACHPDTPHPDRDRLAAVITAYRRLRDQRDNHEAQPPLGDHQASSRAVDIPVRIHDRGPARPGPDLRAGPVRRHSSHG